MRPSKLLLFLVATLLLGAFGLSAVQAASRPAAQSAVAGEAAPAADEALDVALAYVREHRADWGLSAGDVADLTVSDQYTSENSGVTHVYLQQRLNGIGVYNALINVNILPNGTVFHAGSRAVANLKPAVNTTTPTLSPTEAVAAAADALGLTLNEPLRQLEARGGPAQEVLLSDGGISLDAIPVKLVFQPVADGAVRLAWDVTINQTDGLHWWSARVDAVTGALLSAEDWVDHDDWGPAGGVGPTKGVSGGGYQQDVGPFDAGRYALSTPDSYLVYPIPVESPNHTTPAPPADGRVVVTNPADPTASPFGWHDTNGVAGAEYTITRGNNAHAYQDHLDTDTSSGDEPNGGATLDFIFPLDLTQEPLSYTHAAVVNLFYWNNVAHDANYHYGFTEAAGNFQVNNYGRGGLGDDDVRAQAQDKALLGTRNNANFSTPPDGQRPRMQMYLWNLTTPERDGDLDNGIILHEYGHGISNRLTGGPNNAGCLGNAEQMGEGWSDWQTLVFTARATDTGPMRRGIGTYALGEPPSGDGIRAYPYSTDLAVDPRTYADTQTAAVPHGVGSIWTAMLWEVYWNLVGQYGFDPNLYTGTGGNNLAILLVNEGMKLQPCGPGFVDGRDAILAADLAINGGVNYCTIWEGFAKRGLGYSASQGSPNSNADNTEAFDLPPQCLTPDFGLVVQPTELSLCAPASGNATVYVQSFVGYSDPVSLTASGVPTGYAASFSPSTVTPPSTSTLSLTNTGPATPGEYNVTILGTAPTSTHTTTLGVDIYTQAPAPVALLSPTNGAINVSMEQIIFTWSDGGQADLYDFQVATDPGFTNIVIDVQNLEGEEYIVEDPAGSGLQYGTTYYWRVKSDNACGTGAWSQTFSFTTELSPGACQPGQTTNVVYQTDFEDGGPGWVHTGIGDTWTLTNTRTHSGVNAYHADDPETLSDQRLISPPIAVPLSDTTPTLQFWNYQAFEVPNTDGRCWDAGILEVSTTAGATWTVVPSDQLLTDPYDAIIWNDSPGNNPIAAEYGAIEAWCPNPPPQPWLNSVVDLSPYVGQTVQFRFRFGSDSAAGNEGWYIDDVRVQSCQGEPTPTAVTLSDLGSRPSVPVLPLAAFGLLGLAGAVMAWRHRRA